jgi:hypothetical protein
MRIAELEIGELRMRIAKCGIAELPLAQSAFPLGLKLLFAIRHSAFRNPQSAFP